MNCPVCKTPALEQSSLESGLNSLVCKQCGGSWIESAEYKRWQEGCKHGQEHPVSSPIQLISGEVGGAKFCPQCKYVLIKHKVGHDLEFHVDRCGHCAGIWLDQNEWALLCQKGLADRLLSVFSQDWQSQVRQEDHARALNTIWAEMLGEADFKEAQRVKTWIESHPKREELLAFLSDVKKKRPEVVAR